MVKTRKGAKRISPNSSKEEPPDSEKKKPKLEMETKSKYFHVENGPVSDLNTKFNLDENQRNDSNDSNESLFRNKSKTSLKIEQESDSDGSSSDEFMKAPISLDDLGSFETLKKSMKMSAAETKSVQSSSVSKLSDDSDDGENINKQEFYDFSQIMKSQELIMTTKKEQEEKCKQEEQTVSLNKSKIKTTKSTKKRKKDTKPNLQSLGEELGISELLAIAEGPGMVEQDESDDSDSGVDHKEIKTEGNYSVPKEGVEVTIELPNVNQIRKKKGFDVEAALKRRINLIRKENQVFMHKVHTLCWIAHGIYLNRSINNETLMGLALSLIPSNHCYPKKHMDLRYLEKLVEWFVGKVIVAKDKKLNLNSSNLPLVEVLESQINSKKASSERDLVLIFVCMLRSLGINVRLVISLRPVPIRPPITDLCSLSNKPIEENSSNVKNSPSHSQFTSPSKGPTDKTSPKKPKTAHVSKKESSPLKKETEIKSPYFSSSDDLPLTDLIQKKNPSTKPTNLSPLKNVDKMSNSKIISKSNSRKTFSQKISNTSRSSSFNDQKSSEKKKQKVIRKSAPVTFQEHSSSSEDEIFQKRAARQEKPNGSPQKNNSKAVKSYGRRSLKSETNDIDFDPPRPSTSKSKDRRVLSTDDEDSIVINKTGNDYWVEVFVEEEEKWISVDLQKGKVHCINQLYKKATQPVRYVLAWNNDGRIKDVTRRYTPQWLTITRKQRAEDAWWHETMAPYRPPRTAREREEDDDLDRQIHDQPLPSSIADYKNHPLFALKRHLLKFQAIYPPDAPPLGFVKDEPVYSRGCVVELHTREAWIKEAKLVRRGEEPYKIVKARPKYDKLSGARLSDLPLPLFGFWQVEDYIPPPAVDGKVPRNEYGNVELYKPCMLPPGTVHLQVPSLARVARKLDIDCAPAVVGWEFSGGGSHPVLDGFIVCEEFKEILLDAWDKEMDESAKRAQEKVEQRVYGNWKRLIKGLLIRERLKARYDFGETENVPKKKKQPKPGTSKS